MKFFYTYYQKLIIILYALCYYTSDFFKNSQKLLINYNGFGIEEEQKQDNQDVIKSVPFENKYLEEYNKLKSFPLSIDKIESLTNSYLMESTPVGNIVMYYDKKKESFLYYSDNVVPFRYLEPVGRKYVIMFQCKELFQDNNNTTTQSNATQSNATQSNATQSNATATSRQDKPMKTKDILNGIRNPQQKKVILVEKKTNRYTCMGRYSNFKIIKTVNKTTVDKNYSMTFSDFKKMTTNKTLI
jgi:hypothetical protein